MLLCFSHLKKKTFWNFVQVCGMAKNMSSRVRQTWRFVAVCSWENYLTSLRIHFLLSKIAIKIPISKRLLEELNEIIYAKHKKICLAHSHIPHVFKYRMRFPFLITPFKKLSLRNEEVDLSSNPFTTLRLLNYNALSEETQ